MYVLIKIWLSILNWYFWGHLWCIFIRAYVFMHININLKFARILIKSEASWPSDQAWLPLKRLLEKSRVVSHYRPHRVTMLLSTYQDHLNTYLGTLQVAFYFHSPRVWLYNEHLLLSQIVTLKSYFLHLCCFA